MGGEDVKEDEEASIEETGKGVEEAIKNGLIVLELERDEVAVEVLNEGRAGLFGIGGELARVRLTALAPGDRVVEEPAEVAEPGEMPEGEDVEYAKETLETLLELMGVDGRVDVRAPETAGDGLGLVKAVFDVSGEDMGVLIGRRGGTMAALQYLLNVMTSRRFKGNAPFGVDVEGYRQRREEALLELAGRSADRVRDNGRPVTLEPMPPNERRIVHLALANDPTIETGSVGEGERRKVVIKVRQ